MVYSHQLTIYRLYFFAHRELPIQLKQHLLLFWLLIRHTTTETTDRQKVMLVYPKTLCAVGGGYKSWLSYFEVLWNLHEKNSLSRSRIHLFYMYYWYLEFSYCCGLSSFSCIDIYFSYHTVRNVVRNYSLILLTWSASLDNITTFSLGNRLISDNFQWLRHCTFRPWK